MPRLWTTPLLALALTPAFAGCCPDSCGDCVEPAVTETVKASTPNLGGGIASLNGFVENKGQWSDAVLFHAQRGNVEATLYADRIAFRARARPPSDAASPIGLRWPSAGAPAAVEGVDALLTRHHFLLSSASASNARGYRSVRYREVLPGIDLEVHLDDTVFRYDVLVAPGANLAEFAVAVDGADRLEVLDGDRLAIRTQNGVVEQTIGKVWQVDPSNGRRETLACRFRLLDPIAGVPRFGFEVEGREPSYAMVVDPDLSWSTYLGGSSPEQIPKIAVGSDGAVYVMCAATCCAPVTPGALDTTWSGSGDAWVGKISADGKTLEWATFLGGRETESLSGFGLAVDTDGSVVVSGSTWSSDFPTTAGSLQPTFSSPPGKSDIFVSRLSPDGSSLLWSTFFGGWDYDGTDPGNNLGLLSSGDVILAGWTQNALLATPGAYDPEPLYVLSGFSGYANFVMRLSADGATLRFLTYFDVGRTLDVAIGPDDSIFLVGDAVDETPTTPGAFMESPADDNDGFVAKLDAAGSNLLFSTFLGGDGGESTWGVVVDAASAVYVSSQIGHSFPVTTGAFDTSGMDDGAVTKLLPGGTGLVWSTYLSACCGGSGYPATIAVDQGGNAVVGGATNEAGYPTTPDAFQPIYGGGLTSGEVTITKFDAFGESLVYSTYFGGGYKTQIGMDDAGDVLVALQTGSQDFPITSGALQTSIGGSPDLAVARFDFEPSLWKILGGGLAGTKDTPNLAGAGALTPGSPTRLSVRGAAPASMAWLVVGFTAIDVSLLGGTLVPSADVLIPLTTKPTGALDFLSPWPVLPAGTQIYAQVWIADPGAPQGWSATNALHLSNQ